MATTGTGATSVHERVLQIPRAQGLLERARGVDDERLVFIRLTKAGAALKRQAREVPAEIFCATQQTPEFLLRLRDDLTRLRGTLNDYMDQ